MGCSERMMLLASLYIDDALTDKEKEEFNSHLSGCEMCRLRLEELININKSLKNMPQLELPPGIHDQVMLRITNAATPISIITKSGAHKKTRRPKKHKGGFGFSPGFKRFATAAAASCAALLLFGAGLGLAQRPNAADDSGAQSAAISENSVVDILPVPGAALPYAGAADDASPEAAYIPKFSGVSEDYSAIDDYIIKEFNISIAVDDMDAALSAMEALEGHNDSVRVFYGGGANAQSAAVTRRVPASGYDRAKKILRGLGNVISEYEQEQNITFEVMGNTASLNAKAAETERLSALLQSSSSVETMVAIENRLGSVEDQKDALTSQAISSSSRAGYPSLSINITKNKDVISAETPAALSERLTSAFTGSLRVCVAVVEWLMVTASALALPAAAVAIVVFIYTMLAKKGKGRDASGK